MAITSCSTHSGSTSVTPSGDTTFTGAYFTLNYSGKSETIKAYTLKSSPANATVNTESVTNSSGQTVYVVIALNSANINYLAHAQLAFFYTGSGTGSYPIYNNAGESGFLSGTSEYSDTTGTVTITYSGSDYLEGSFTSTMYGSGLSIPATGSFKIIH